MTEPNNYALMEAASRGYLEIVKYLTSLKDKQHNLICNPETRHNRALKLATLAGHLEVVNHLICFKSIYTKTIPDICYEKTNIKNKLAKKATEFAINALKEKNFSFIQNLLKYNKRLLDDKLIKRIQEPLKNKKTFVKKHKL